MGDIGFFIIIFYAFYLGIAYLVGRYGKKRRIGFWPAFLISAFFSPIMGLIFSFLLGPKNSSTDTIFDEVIERSNFSASSKSKWAEEREYRNLQDSYARGDITKTEYEEVKKRLDEQFGRN